MIISTREPSMGLDSLHRVSALVPSNRQEVAALCILIKATKGFQRTTLVTCKCLTKSRTSCPSIRLRPLQQAVLTIAVSLLAGRQASSYSSRRPTISFKDGTCRRCLRRIRRPASELTLRKENNRSEITRWKSTRDILRLLTQRTLLNRFSTARRRPQPRQPRVIESPHQQTTSV